MTSDEINSARHPDVSLSSVGRPVRSKTPATLGPAPSRWRAANESGSVGIQANEQRPGRGAGSRVGRPAAVEARGLAARSLWQYVSSGMAVAVAAAAGARAAVAAVEAGARAASAVAPRGV